MCSSVVAAICYETRNIFPFATRIRCDVVTYAVHRAYTMRTNETRFRPAIRLQQRSHDWHGDLEITAHYVGTKCGTSVYTVVRSTFCALLKNLLFFPPHATFL